jgi:WD40 repeat protein
LDGPDFLGGLGFYTLRDRDSMRDHTTGMLRQGQALARESIGARARRFLRGNDVFISYARADSAAYALALASELTKRKLQCYLDQWGTPPGQLSPEVLGQLERSSMLVVIGSEAAGISPNVAAEVERFLKTRRPVVPINVAGVLEQARWFELIRGISLTFETRDAFLAGHPSDGVATRIENAEGFTRRNKQLRRTFWATVASIGVILGIGGVAVVRGRRDLTRARKATELEMTAASILSAYPSGTGELPALRTLVRMGGELRDLAPAITRPDQYPTVSPILALQTVLSRIHEKIDFNTKGRDVSSVDISPDGKYVVIAQSDGYIGGKFTISIWGTDGAKVAEWDGGDGGANDLRFIDNNHFRVLPARTDLPTRVFDLAGKVSKMPQGTEAAFAAENRKLSPDVRWSHAYPDGIRVEVTSQAIRVVEASGAVRKQWNTGGYTSSAAFDSNHPVFATADQQNATLWSLNGDRVATLAHPGGRMSSIYFAPNGDRIITAAANGSISVWDPTGKHIMDLNGHQAIVSAVRFDSTGNQILSASRDGSVRLWVMRNTLEQQVSAGTSVVDVAFRPDGVLATLNVSGTVKLWSRDGQLQSSIELMSGSGSPPRPRPSMGYSYGGLASDASLAATSGSDGNTTILWRITGPAPVELLRVASSALHVEVDAGREAVCAIPAGGGATIHSSNGDARIFPPGGWLYSCAFSPMEPVVATVGADSSVRLWNFSGTKVSEFRTEQLQTLDVDFSPDGTTMAVAGGDGTIRFFRRDGTETVHCSGHTGRILGVRFSPDGGRLASIGMDNTVRVWDVSGRQLAQFEVAADSIIHEVSGGDAGHLGIAFSPNGDRLAVGGAAGNVYVWPIESLGELVEQGKRWLAVSAVARGIVPSVRR